MYEKEGGVVSSGEGAWPRQLQVGERRHDGWTPELLASAGWEGEGERGWSYKRKKNKRSRSF